MTLQQITTPATISSVSPQIKNSKVTAAEQLAEEIGQEISKQALGPDISEVTKSLKSFSISELSLKVAENNLQNLQKKDLVNEILNEVTKVGITGVSPEIDTLTTQLGSAARAV